MDLVFTNSLNCARVHVVDDFELLDATNETHSALFSTLSLRHNEASDVIMVRSENIALRKSKHGVSLWCAYVDNLHVSTIDQRFHLAVDMAFSELKSLMNYFIVTRSY